MNENSWKQAVTEETEWLELQDDGEVGMLQV